MRLLEIVYLLRDHGHRYTYEPENMIKFEHVRAVIDNIDYTVVNHWGSIYVYILSVSDGMFIMQDIPPEYIVAYKLKL